MHIDRNTTAINYAYTIESDVLKYEKILTEGVEEKSGIEFWQTKIATKKLTAISKFEIDPLRSTSFGSVL